MGTSISPKSRRPTLAFGEARVCRKHLLFNASIVRREQRLLLSLALFIIMYNFLESLWMRGFEFLWVVFVIVAAEIGRYWQPLPLKRAAYNPRSRKLGNPGRLPGTQPPRLRIRLS